MSLDPGENPSLDGMLEALAEEARRDSSGSFTLDPRKAIEKFAAFQLSGSFWGLKVVQAAVAGGASSMELAFRGDQTIWKLKGPGWNCGEVERALWHPETKAEAGLHHLRIALWSAGFGQQKPFTLEAPGWDRRLRWDGRHFHRDSATHCATVELRVSGVDASPLKKVLRLAKSCPIPFSVAGVSLNRGRPRAHVLFSGYPRADLFCQLFCAPEGGLRLFHWVKDGVVVGTYCLEDDRSNLYCDWYFTDSKVTTDLSGLSLISPLEPEVISTTNQMLAESTSRLHELLLEREGDPEPPRRNNISFWESTIVVGAITMLATDPAFGGVILLAGVLGTRLNPPKVSPGIRRHQELIDYVATLKEEPWQLSDSVLLIGFE